MPVDIGSSILDDALAYMGERILTILCLASDDDENHIGSLHNKLVSIVEPYK
jgi:hypothetical protein